MKKLLFILFALVSFASFAQTQTGGIFLRVNDSTTYVNSSSTTALHSAGYADIWYSNSSDLYWVWNGSAYVNWIGAFLPLTLTGNTSITGDFGLNLGTAANHLDSFSVYTETRMLLHAQAQLAIDVHDDITSDIVTVDAQPKSLTIQAGSAAQTVLQINDEDGGNGLSVQTTANPIYFNPISSHTAFENSVLLVDAPTVLDTVTYFLGRRSSDGTIVRKTVASVHANSSSALTDGAAITITGLKHTLTSTQATVTWTLSQTSDFQTTDIILNATSTTWTFPANALCVVDGVASGTNTAALTGVSGDHHIMSIYKDGTNYRVVIKNFGQ